MMGPVTACGCDRSPAGPFVAPVVSRAAERYRATAQVLAGASAIVRGGSVSLRMSIRPAGTVVTASQKLRESVGRRHSAGLMHRRIVYSMCRNVRLCTLCVVWWLCGSNEGVYRLLLMCLCLATSHHALRFDKKCVWPTLSALLALHRGKS